MYNSPSSTLFIGNKVIYLPSCTSTNDEAATLMKQGGVSEGMVLITDEQQKGRGQRGAYWEARPNQNLTLSVILQPTFLAATDSFRLNVCISLGVHDFVERTVGLPAFIKWPNDIIIADKKVSGILIETQISGSNLVSSVVGIGLNVNQVAFSIPQATSFRILTQKSYSLEDLFETLLVCLEKRYLQLRNGEYTQQQEHYQRRLFRYGVMQSFQTSEGRFLGSIQGVDANGRLKVEVDGKIDVFLPKEIQLFY